MPYSRFTGADLLGLYAAGLTQTEVDELANLVDAWVDVGFLGHTVVWLEPAITGHAHTHIWLQCPTEHQVVGRPYFIHGREPYTPTSVTPIYVIGRGVAADAHVRELTP